MRTVFLVAVIVTIAIIAGGAVAISSYSGYFTTSPPSNNPQVDHFTIIESDPPAPLAGMNGSYYKPVSVQWPVIKVHQGDTVIITVVNINSSEVHGFAIDHYFNSGVSTSPGQSHTVTFVANEVGTFRMYCDVFCTIHPLMQNGALIVSAS